MTVVEKIKTRGYWTIRIYPEEYKEDRVQSHAALEHNIQNSSVALRGWDFPHIDPAEPSTRKQAYLQQTTDWQHYVELWRAYKSAQFVFLGAIHGEWRDQSRSWAPDPGWQPGQFLHVEDTIFFLLEVLEFASRFVRCCKSYGNHTVIDIRLHGTAGRMLVPNPARPFLRRNYVASDSNWTFCRTYATAELFSRPKQLAAAPTGALLGLFDLDVNEDLIAAIQSRIGRT
jgi:hypothetical protein